MTTYLVLFPLDVLRASQLAGQHRNVQVVPGGYVTCDRCARLLTAEEWAAPCPGRDGDAA